MPSSVIFAGLVAVWLLLLVPAVARHRQEVARPSVAALSGRVLERPSRGLRTEEVDDVHDPDDDVARGDTRAATARIPVAREEVPAEHEPSEHESSEHEPADYDEAGYDYDEAGPEQLDWERPAPRYKPGRGGFDPDAAALTARARYTFRQRAVLALLVAAVGTALVALVSVPVFWGVHVAVDVALVGYLVYLRRQVRMEEAIRDRRAARMAGTRRPPAAEDPELDEWARRGAEVARRPEPAPAAVEDDEEFEDDLVPDRVVGTGEPLGPIASRPDVGDEPALPRLTPAPPPAIPAGTTVVDGDLDDPGLHDLDAPERPDHRRAVGE